MTSIPAKPDFRSRTPDRRVVILVYPGVTLLDATGPAQVFSSANTALATKGKDAQYSVTLASPDGGEVITDTGIALVTTPLQQISASPIDTLIISGGDGVFDAMGAGDIVDWIVARHEECRRLASTCMGAFVTAEIGLLDGRNVTTHWRHAAELQRRYPRVRVQCDPLFLSDGKIWSSAGVTAGIDLALAMVEEDLGHEAAMHVAQSLVVFLKRPGGQSQFSNVLTAQRRDFGGTFSELQAWIADNLRDDMTVERLAEHAGMSARTFARRYKGRTGITPAKAVELMRVDAAKRLLERGTASLTGIAADSGLGDEQRLRRAFVRHVGVSPAEYRRKFGTDPKP